MEVKVAATLRLIGSVHADDVVLLVFDPDSSYKVRSLDLLVRNNVEDERAHIAKKFLPQIFQVIVLRSESMAKKDKLHESFRQIGHLVKAIKAIEHPREHPGFLLVVTQVIDAALIEDQTAEEVLVAGRHLA